MNILIGHNHLIDLQLNLIKKNKFPSASLFLGPAGVGKFKAAEFVAKTLLCNSLDKRSGFCGSCSSCFQFQEKLHPDYLLLDTEDKTIKIDHIREIRKQAHHSPLVSSLKVVLIRDAHKMNQASSNALLKVLEEPPHHFYFILVSHAANRLLATILSRCQKSYFSPLTQEECKKIVMEESSESFPPTWLELGSPGLILRWLQCRELMTHQIWKNFFRNPSGMTLHHIIDFCTHLKTNNDYEAFYEWLLFTIAQKLRLDQNFNLLKFSDSLCDLINLRVFNFNQALALEALLTEYKEGMEL